MAFRYLRAVSAAGLLLLSFHGQAQTLAQRNWAGSGVTVEPWWQRAVFYRIDPARFQDSDGDGKGDLAGIVQRLDYLQSLGVDAIILDAGSEAAKPMTVAPEGFDDLARAAVSHRLRVLVALGVPASQSVTADAEYLARARAWLNQGAAGLYVPTRALTKVDGTGHIGALFHQLRVLTNGFPGGRVLIGGAPASADLELASFLVKETQLSASAPLAGSGAATIPSAAALRAQLQAALTDGSGAGITSYRGRSKGGDPLLLAARGAPLADAAAQGALQRALAAMLLGSRDAVILDYGQELGLVNDAGNAPVMQWTPSNITATPAPPSEPKTEEHAAPKAEYQGFHEFVPPPKAKLPAPRMPEVVESDDPQPVTVDMSTLPGFTGGTLDAALTAPNAATANLAMEQNDTKSLLNLYKQLIQLRHDNATLRNGTQTLLDRDADSALVWVRRPTAGGRSSVVVACDLSEKAITISGRDVGMGPLRTGIRPMLGEAGGSEFTVPGHSVGVGEIR